jgi:hypothetical protein
MGCSSGAAAAMAMALYRPDLYHRVLVIQFVFAKNAKHCDHGVKAQALPLGAGVRMARI